jgi:hypothetical protein
MFNDFKLKFKWQYDGTFWLHLLRDAILCFVFSFINYSAGIFFALGVNTSWEWQDGLLNDGFNLCDWIAGVFGIGIALIVHSYFF